MPPIWTVEERVNKHIKHYRRKKRNLFRAENMQKAVWRLYQAARLVEYKLFKENMAVYLLIKKGRFPTTCQGEQRLWDRRWPVL